MHKLLEKLNLYGSIFFKATVAIGVGIVFIYCAFHINFFPTGLTIGDSLVFLYIALGFGVFYAFWLLSGVLAIFLAFYSPASGTNVSVGERFFMYLCSFCFFAFLIFFGFKHDNNLAIFLSVFIPLLSGFILLIVIFIWNPQEEELSEEHFKGKKRARIGIGIFAAFVLPFVASAAMITSFINTSISILGVQQQNQSIVLDQDNYKIIANIAEELDLPLYSCTSKGGKNIIHNVNVLWHGIGERTLVEMLTMRDGKKNRAVRVELDRKGIKVLQILDEKLYFRTCLTFDSDSIFGKYASKPTKEGKKKIDKFIRDSKEKLKLAGLKVITGKVIGHSDRQPIETIKDSNLELSIRRAQSVHDQIIPLFSHLTKTDIAVIGHGSSESLSNCPKGLQGKELNECLSVDRRVEIIFKVQKDLSIP